MQETYDSFTFAKRVLTDSILTVTMSPWAEKVKIWKGGALQISSWCDICKKDQPEQVQLNHHQRPPLLYSSPSNKINMGSNY